MYKLIVNYYRLGNDKYRLIINKMEAINLKKGQEVYFVGEKLPMKVSAVSDNFAIVTRNIHRRHDYEIIKYEAKEYFKSFNEAFEALKDEVVYSIIDFKNSVKGAHNSWDFGIEWETLEKDSELILEAIEKSEIEISRRNSCKLNIDWKLTI
jgi:hypothetical protein